MGANPFYTKAHGADAREAFRAAQDEAQAMFGHQEGYSGAVNSKDSFVMIRDTPERVLERAREAAELWTVQALESATTPSDVVAAIANALMDLSDERVSSKHGPAGCIRLGDTDEYLFFGWAPS